MITEQTKRVFKYNGRLLEDLAPDLSPEESIKMYRDQYPELTNFEVSFDQVDTETQSNVYIVSGKVGTKG